MRKSTALALIGALAIANPAFARTTAEIEADIKASKEAIAKDEADLQKYEAELEKDRAQKAAAKSNKEYGKQAKESVEIGADKAMIKAKQAEKKIDEKILERDMNKEPSEASPAAGVTTSKDGTVTKDSTAPKDSNSKY
jgi:hypothetical protein